MSINPPLGTIAGSSIPAPSIKASSIAALAQQLRAMEHDRFVPHPHPENWNPYKSRLLDSMDEAWEVLAWLRVNCKGKWDCVTHHSPRVVVSYFDNKQDAVLFKLTWGGK